MESMPASFPSSTTGRWRTRFSDMTAIDESELGQRYKVGKELCGDLDDLYKENCCNKQNFFVEMEI